MRGNSRKLKRLGLAIVFSCTAAANSLAQTTANSADKEELEKISGRLARLSMFIAEAGEKEAPHSLSITGEPIAVTYSKQLKRVQSEISGLSSTDAIKRLETINVPPRVQELLEQGPDGTRLPLAPHQELGKVQFASLEPFIVGPGTAATVDYPSVANITYARAGTAHETICTGTLVSSDAVLTAAHCFCDLAGEQVRTATKCSSAVYRRGLEPLKTTNAKYFQIFFQGKGPFSVNEIFINPEYDFPRKDLAIIKLSTPVMDVMPAPLNDVGPLDNNSYATVVGFGVHSPFDGKSPRSSEQPLASSQGLKLWATIKTAKCGGAKSLQEIICWNYQPRVADAVLGSTCYGDSGGPLFAKFNNEWKLAGVTSGGPRNCSSTQPDQQSYDVDVFMNRAWIETAANISHVLVPIKTAFLVDNTATAYSVAYHIFTEQPDEWVSQFYLPPKLKSVTVSINATPTFSKLVLELRPSDPTLANTCRDERSDSFAACRIENPTEGVWTVSIRGSRPQELQVVAAVTR